MRSLLAAVLLFGHASGFSATSGLGGDEELLHPDQAYQFSAKPIGTNTIRAQWKIADGYYMYRDKFRFQTSTQGVYLGAPVFPPGKIKTDEFFGKVEIYRGTVAIDLPVTRDPGAADSLSLRVTSQGCADLGVCYPPHIQTALLNLPKAKIQQPFGAQKTSDPGPLATLKGLGQSLGLGQVQDEFLPPDKAFSFTTELADANTLLANWQIADGYYLYRDKIELKTDSQQFRLAVPPLPKGKLKEGIRPDGTEGEVDVYLHSLELRIPIRRAAPEGGDLNVIAKFQGCAAKGVCYPPMEKTVLLKVPAGSVSTAVSAANSMTGEPEDNDNRSFIGNILFAFGVGLLLTFTPCVLPMVPILFSIIVGTSGKQPSKTRCASLSLVYVAGTAVTYSVAGWIAGSSGSQLQAYMQNAWVLGTFSIILAGLALSMFGFYEIQIPAFIQSRLQHKSRGLKGGSVAGVFVMGLLSALIIGACVTPLLMLVLGIALTTGDPVLGASIMFAMSLGMGVFLVLVGVGAVHLLPKAGRWMDTVKYVFGALLLAVAIYLLRPIEEVPVLLLWGILLISSSVYMGATQSLPEGTSGWRYLWKGLGTALLIWGVLALLGSIQGNRDMFQPVELSQMMGKSTSSAQQSGSTIDPHNLFIPIADVAQLNRRLANAKAVGKPVMLDYFATWCTDCLRMEKITFGNPRVQQIMQERFIALQVDVTDPTNKATEAVKKRFSVFGPPALLFFDKDGKQRKDLNFYGFKEPGDFISILNQL